MLRLLQYGYIAFGAAGLGYALFRGHSRRRSHWARRSWLTFYAAFTVAVLLCASAVVSGEWIAQGAYASQPNLRGILIVANLALLCCGAALLALLVSWFAYSTPQGTFPDAFRASIRQTLFPAPPDKKLKPTATPGNLVE